MTFWGLSLAALSYAVVLMLCLVHWRERLLGIWLQLALFFNLLWAAYLAWDALAVGSNPANQIFLEILRDTAWLLFVLKLFDHGRGGRDFWSWKVPWIVLWVVLLLLLLNLVELVSERYLSRMGIALVYLAPLMLVTAILVTAEQWYRNVPLDQRWAVKFLLVGLGVIFGYDFVLYSEALLFNRMDPAFGQARGWVGVVAAPLVAIAASRARDWNRELRISRRAIFFSTSLLLAGCYLLLMSMVGYYLKWFGTGVGSALQIVFIVTGTTLFVLLVTSGRVRSQVTVWLNKHFLSYKYDYRSEWMQANARLASLPMDERYYRELLLGITEPVGSKGGVLWIHESDRLVPAHGFNV